MRFDIMKSLVTVANLNEMFESIKRMKLAIGINNG